MLRFGGLGGQVAKRRLAEMGSHRDARAGCLSHIVLLASDFVLHHGEHRVCGAQPSEGKGGCSSHSLIVDQFFNKSAATRPTDTPLDQGHA